MYITCSAWSLWGHCCSSGSALSIPTASGTLGLPVELGWLQAGSGHPPAQRSCPGWKPAQQRRTQGCWSRVAEREPVCAREGKKPMAPGLYQ